MKIKLLLLFLCTFISVQVSAQKKEIKESTISWKAYKVLSGHEGTLKLKEGFLNFENGKISGGTFVVDMTTLTCTDLKGGWKDKLENHLKDKDFFSTDEYPTCKLVLNKVNYDGAGIYNAKGILTIKGISKPIALTLKLSDKKNLTSSLSINRIDYNIKYNSKTFFENLGDKVILDNFDIDVNMTF